MIRKTITTLSIVALAVATTALPTAAAGISGSDVIQNAQCGASEPCNPCAAKNPCAATNPRNSCRAK